jgi:hypothetical protein
MLPQTKTPFFVGLNNNNEPDARLGADVICYNILLRSRFAVESNGPPEKACSDLSLLFRPFLVRQRHKNKKKIKEGHLFSLIFFDARRKKIRTVTIQKKQN